MINYGLHNGFTEEYCEIIIRTADNAIKFLGRTYSSIIGEDKFKNAVNYLSTVFCY